ncbi:hypothetical protein [Allosphingosinicella sp.]|uniref:hypothetical protein n=1 Tax=Allosphingosinicella sp. TaxID=2823234 RepID=UPI003784B926
MDRGLTELRFSRGGAAVQVACGMALTTCCIWLAYLSAFGVLWLAAGLFLFWQTIRVGWHFVTRDEAAALTAHGLRLHRSYARTEIPFARISAVDIGPEIISMQNIYIRVRGRLRIRIQSNEVEGGKPALLAFAEELKARMAFGGDEPQRDG